jgi:hypothetical protein
MLAASNVFQELGLARTLSQLAGADSINALSTGLQVGRSISDLRREMLLYLEAEDSKWRPVGILRCSISVGCDLHFQQLGNMNQQLEVAGLPIKFAPPLFCFCGMQDYE